MTQKDFIRKFEHICQTNCVTAIDTENWTCGVQMCYINCQDSEIANEFVEVIGFDADNCFYIDFCDGCTAYPWDLDCNCEDAWDLLWSAVLDHFESDSTDDEHDFKVGDKVYWNGQCVEDYPAEEQAELLSRRFVVVAVHGEYMDSIIEITDCYTDAEVTADELVHCHQVEM